MKEASCENIFEASSRCSIIAKFLGGNFVTVKRDNYGKYFAYTSIYDVFRVLFGIIFGIFLLREVAKTTAEKDENRSIIFEIIISINSQIEAIQPTLVMIITYHFRFLYFWIKNELLWIDQNVSIYLGAML
jgi:phosphatidylglycerophosphatase A